MKEALAEGWVSGEEDTELLDITGERKTSPNLADLDEAMTYFFDRTIDGVWIGKGTGETVSESTLDHVRHIVNCERYRLMGQCISENN